MASRLPARRPPVPPPRLSKPTAASPSSSSSSPMDPLLSMDAVSVAPHPSLLLSSDASPDLNGRPAMKIPVSASYRVIGGGNAATSTCWSDSSTGAVIVASQAASTLSPSELDPDYPDGMFARLPDEIISVIFNSIPKLSRFQCVMLNRRLSRIAASCLWRSIGCWQPAFPESRLRKILDILESEMPPAPTATAATTITPKALMYPYLHYVRKLVVMIYHTTNPTELREFVTRIRRVLIERVPSARRLTLAYRGPAAWGLDTMRCLTHGPTCLHAPPHVRENPTWEQIHDPPTVSATGCRWSQGRGAVLEIGGAISQIGLYWMSDIGIDHMAMIARNCRRLRLLHLQPDRALRQLGFSAAITVPPRDMDGADDDFENAMDTERGGAPATVADDGTSAPLLQLATAAIPIPPPVQVHIAPPPDGVMNPIVAASAVAAATAAEAAAAKLADTNARQLAADRAIAAILRSNSTGRLVELNLWHLPLSGAFVSEVPWRTLRMLTFGNTVVPERALLALTHPLPNTTMITIEHPRDRPRRSATGVAHLVSLAQNLETLILKHVLFSRALADAIALRGPTSLTMLVLSPVEGPWPWGRVPLGSVHLSQLDNAVTLEPPVGLFGDPAPPPNVLAPHLPDPATEYAAEVQDLNANFAIVTTACRKLTTLELGFEPTAENLVAVAHLPSLRELRLKSCLTVRPASIRGLVASLQEGQAAMGMSGKAARRAAASASVPVRAQLRTLTMDHAPRVQDASLMELIYAVPSLRYLSVLGSHVTVDMLSFAASRGLGNIKKLVVSSPMLRSVPDVAEVRAAHPAAMRRVDVVPYSPFVDPHRMGGAAAALFGGLGFPGGNPNNLGDLMMGGGPMAAQFPLPPPPPPPPLPMPPNGGGNPLMVLQLQQQQQFLQQHQLALQQQMQQAQQGPQQQQQVFIHQMMMQQMQQQMQQQNLMGAAPPMQMQIPPQVLQQLQMQQAQMQQFQQFQQAQQQAQAMAAAAPVVAPVDVVPLVDGVGGEEMDILPDLVNLIGAMLEDDIDG
ncbi:hypothetical protein BC828DRAFT_416565 [Blastocladiella britannica]|nr:hypothetical protein BC828DRAFT_416565 [Blastocladiella britannica]